MKEKSNFIGSINVTFWHSQLRRLYTANQSFLQSIFKLSQIFYHRMELIKKDIPIKAKFIKLKQV